MKPELKAKIVAYNKRVAAERDKATDMEVLISAISKLPWGQLKKLLNDEVVAILEKYGVR
jgi:hypothetical protein